MISRDDRIQFLIERIYRLRDQMPENKQRMIDFDLLVRLLNKIKKDLDDNKAFTNYCSTVDLMLNLISEDIEFSKPSRKEYFNIQEKLYTELRMEHHYVRSGYYLAIFLPLSLAVGPGLGILIQNMGVGLAIIILSGILLGSYLDMKAKKDGKQY